MWVTQGRSHPGLADRPPKPTEPPEKLSLQSRTFLEEEEEVAVPRAGISCSAGPGPNPKVRGLYHLEPTLTDKVQLHKNRDLKLSLEVLVMSLPALLRAL